MMSETNARARRFARWFGSFERNGLSGRRAPLSEIAGDAPGGVVEGRDGAVGWNASAGRDCTSGRAGGEDGMNGGADSPGADTGWGAAAGRGETGGAEYSGTLDTLDGGVCVATAGSRCIGPGLDCHP